MPTFVIKTADPSVDFAIEAEKFYITLDKNYSFYEGETLVAKLNAEQVLAIINEDNLLTPDYEDEDLKDDECDDYRTAELLRDRAFRDAVCELVEDWHEQPRPSEVKPSAPEPEVAQPAGAIPNYPVEYRNITHYGPCWGVADVERNRFVPFGPEAGARDGVERYARDPSRWCFETLSNCPLVEVPHV